MREEYKLKQLDALPVGLLDASPKMLHSFFPNPTLIHLQGKRPEPLFISVMLHGNEPTGLFAVQSLLKKYQHQQLPRSISLFFGNTEAAQQGLRRLDNQLDFNRIWPGTDFPNSPETRIAAEIVDVMKDRLPFASIDVHNNTGLNPHYACVNKLDHQYLHLASHFSRLIVYFIRPKGVLSAAFAKICPAVTLECGRPGQQHGTEHTNDYLDTCLHLSELPNHPITSSHIDLFHTVAQVKIHEAIDFSFQHNTAQLLLDKDLEWMNFTEIPAGTVFGRVNNNTTLPLSVKDEFGNDVSQEYFSMNDQELQIKRQTMPSMLTLDKRVIRQDCFCYLMERIHL